MNIPFKSVKKRPIAEINVVPYIDVMLVLLVIFMITTPLLSQGVNVNLPQAKAQPLEPKAKEPIVVSVDENGNYYLNIAQDPSQALDPALIGNTVQNALNQAKQEGKEQPVLVKGDQAVSYGKIMTAMVLLQQAGASSVGLVTESPAKND